MRKFVTYMVFGLLGFSAVSQEETTLSYAEQLRKLELEMDSLSIFNLIDSLFALEVSQSGELNIRLGFTNSVTSAGRDYDLNQKGISSGISYYHRSGVYTDLSGYWNSGVSPNYNPTVFSIGYLGTINPKWIYSFDYEKWFFNPKDSSENPLTHSIGTSLTYDFKIGYVSADYSFLFGAETAHRFIGNLVGTINLGKWWVFKRINLYPGVSILYGNSDVTRLRITQNQLSEETKRRFQLLVEFSELTDQERYFLLSSVRKAYESGKITEQRRNELQFLIRNSANLTDADVNELKSLINDGFESSVYENGNAFGLLNYAISIPLSLSTNRFNILLSYTYSIPISLPGEVFEIDPIGYFGASISYRIQFK